MSQASDSHINSALAQLRQAFERVRALGDFKSLGEALPTGARREALDNDLMQIYVVSRHLREAIQKRVASDSLPVAQLGPELWQFYEKEFLPNEEALHALYFHSLFAELDLSTVIEDLGTTSDGSSGSEEMAETPERQVDAAFSMGMCLVRDKFEDNLPWWGLDEDGVRKAELIQSASFFTPEEWSRNLADLRPIITDRPLKNHPIHVRVRLVEIGRSFIFGNWLAVLALCRSLLEYALINQATSRGIEAFEVVRGERRSRRLADLIEEYSERIPELALPMNTINEFGNHVMHPKKSYDVIRFPNIMRSNSLQAIDALRSVLAVL
jgi:hypothetical protein